MLKKLSLEVQASSEGIVFRFEQAVHILTFAITSTNGEFLWKLTPATARPAPHVESIFSAVPLEEATLESKKQLEALQTDDTELLTAIDQVTYGHVPLGLKEKAPAVPLARGMTYNALLLGAEGHAAEGFVA